MPAPWWTALRAPRPTVPHDLTTWWAWHLHVDAPSTIARAALAASRADRLASAFTSGYQAALESLFGERILGALAVTEAGGGHPRAIHTTWKDGVVSGTKTFVTGGARADAVWVVARVGDTGARPRLKVVRVPSEAAGLTWASGPTPPFVPEVAHGVLTLTDTPCAEALEGDGYARYVKPFRTVEDLHVLAAALGMALGDDARAHHVDAAWTETALALLVSIDALGSCRPTDAAVHLPLASLSRQVVEHLTKAPWAHPDRWARDRALLGIADVVRQRRTQRAWEAWRGGM